MFDPIFREPRQAQPTDNASPQKIIIGTIHLQALPGSPRHELPMQAIVDAARHDAEAYQEGNCHGIIIENFFDAPFFKDRVGAETVAAMAAITAQIRQEIDIPIGINVLRNDGMSALAIAAACDCQFVRINQIAWAMLTDQGIIEGKAAETLRYRRLIGSKALIFADCLVKHAVSFAPQTMQQVAMDTWERGGADALIISGIGTGHGAKPEDVHAAREGAPDAPILIGSGTTPETLEDLLPHVDGFIVGTYCKQEGILTNPVDVARVRQLTERI